MSCQNCWKKLLPFGLTLTLSIFAVLINQTEGENQEVNEKKVYVVTGVQSTEIIKFADKPIPENADVFITSKPRPPYNNLARLKETQGTVTLRVTFLANGEIGKIRVVEGLPNGLSEQAIIAAMNIKFKPARKNRIPYTVTRKIQYNFTIY